jgi:hypothetical protein
MKNIFLLILSTVIVSKTVMANPNQNWINFGDALCEEAAFTRAVITDCKFMIRQYVKQNDPQFIILANKVCEGSYSQHGAPAANAARAVDCYQESTRWSKNSEYNSAMKMCDHAGTYFDILNCQHDIILNHITPTQK